MAPDSAMKFDYGDGVELIERSDLSRFGILRGSVCGFRTIGAAEAPLARLAEGTILVLVEGESGASVEIPSNRLRRIE